MPKHPETGLERIDFRQSGWTEVLKRNMELLNDALLYAEELLDVDDTFDLNGGDVLRWNGYIQKFQNIPGSYYFPATTTSTTTSTTTTSTSTTSTTTTSTTVSTTTSTTSTTTTSTTVSTTTSTTVSTTTTTAAPLTSFYTNFGEYATGVGVPTGWIEKYSTGLCAPEIEVSAGDLGGKVMFLDHSATTGRYAVAYNHSDLNDIDDVQALVRFKVASALYDANAQIFIRGGDSGSGTAYLANIRPNSSSVRISRFDSGGTTATLGSAAKTINADEWYWCRLQIQGTAIKLKVWNTDDSEPGSWDVEATDSNYLSGWTGVGNFREDSRWDYFHIETVTGNWPISLPVLPTTTTTTTV